jgi:hypothetical protein
MNNQQIRDAQRLNLLPSLIPYYSLDANGNYVFNKDGMQGLDIMDYIKGLNVK